MLTIDKDVRYYKLFYSQGTHRDDKIFPFKGGLKDAITRGRKHCEVMGYRFIMVRPGIVDLDHQERLKFDNLDWSEDQNEPAATLIEKIVK